jgi:hypothetical protein
MIEMWAFLGLVLCDYKNFTNQKIDRIVKSPIKEFPLIVMSGTTKNVRISVREIIIINDIQSINFVRGLIRTSANLCNAFAKLLLISF